jgi:hypothetical protein
VAADEGSIAFDGALRSLEPPLRPRDFHKVKHRTRQRPRDQALGRGVVELERTIDELDRAIDERDKRIDTVEAWTLAAGVGLRPRELAHLNVVLGRPIYYLADPPNNVQVYRYPEDPDPADVERALLTVADVILRLWISDSFRPPADGPAEQEPG